MKKLLMLSMLFLLSGCGLKDPSFYDLKSPCVSINMHNDLTNDPCIRTSPLLNELILNS